jgi:predicted nucleotidyltransferase
VTPPTLDELSHLLATVLARRSEVLDAYLFGSLTRGEAQPHSDLDVAVYVEEAALRQPGFGIGAEIASDLSQALGRNDVDVVVLNDVPPLLYRSVLKDGVRLVSRDLEATTTREGWALSRYCDFVPQLEKIERTHRARIRAGAFGR